MTDFTNMSGPELVRAFNAMAGSVPGQELQARPVNRFATPEVGRKRCEKLASSIAARERGLAAVDEVPSPPVEVAFDSEERVMARKAKAKKPKAERPNGILGEFETNLNKFRGKCLHFLWEHKNEQLTWKQLVKATYGANASYEGHHGKITMVLRGVNGTITKKKFKHYELVAERGEEGTTYGLYTKT